MSDTGKTEREEAQPQQEPTGWLSLGGGFIPADEVAAQNISTHNLRAVFLNSPPAQPFPEVCCTDFRDCHKPCVPRAEHWKEIALNAGAEELAAIARAQPAQEAVAWTDEQIEAVFKGYEILPISVREELIEACRMLIAAYPPARPVPEGWVIAEVAAKICDDLAYAREQGAGLIHGPGSRLRQAARLIRELAAAPKPGGE